MMVMVMLYQRNYVGSKDGTGLREAEECQSPGNDIDESFVGKEGRSSGRVAAG